MANDHAKLSASAADRWSVCPGSIELCERVPQVVSEYAEAGTRAHQQAEAMINGSDEPWPDLAADVVMYVDIVKELSNFGDLHVEERVTFDEWVPEGYGTADALIIGYNGDLHVVDLKTGRVPREADCAQLKLYGLGALQEYQFTHGIERVHLHIVQPPLDHHDEVEFSVDELLDWGDWITQRAALCVPGAPLVPGEYQCRWCDARVMCAERVRWLVESYRPGTIDLPGLAKLYEVTPSLKAWCDDVESAVRGALAQGDNVPGWKLVEGKSRRALTPDAADILSAHGLGEAAIYRAPELRTLSDLEKALGGKKKAAPILEQCTTRTADRPVLVRASDPRPAIGPTSPDAFPIGD